MQLGIVVLLIGLLTWRGACVENQCNRDYSAEVSANLLKTDGCERMLGRSGRGQSGNVYAPKIEFQYSYQGKTYSSISAFRASRAAFYTMQECEQYIASLTEQRQLTAWLDPQAPASAVLNRDQRSNFLELFAISLGIMLLVVFGIKNLKLFPQCMKSSATQCLRAPA